MKKELVKEIIRDFHMGVLPETLPRDLKIPLNFGKIVTLIGVRRSGKTFLLFETMKQFMDRKGISKEHILYLNFEDERLELKRDELQYILHGYQELYPELDLSKCYFFFDEVQNLLGWEKFVRRIYESVTRNIFITGSNAKLLSREIATSLRGRTIAFYVYPLSFGEYLQFHGVEKDMYHSPTQAKIVHAFEKFMREGGFPELVYLQESLKEMVLQEYFNVMLYRDLIERFQFRNIVVLKYLLKRVMESVTTPLSINKIYHELKSQGYKVGKNMLYEYVDAAEAVFMILAVRKYSASVLKRELSAQKVYVVDNGLLNAVSAKFTKDLGKLLENLVLTELAKQGKSIFFYKNRKECDFVIVEAGSVEEAFQVCYTVSDPDTLKRELEGLTIAMRKTGAKNGYILTMEEEKRIEKDGFVVNILPAWKFFLST